MQDNSSVLEAVDASSRVSLETPAGQPDLSPSPRAPYLLYNAAPPQEVVGSEQSALQAVVAADVELMELR